LGKMEAKESLVNGKWDKRGQIMCTRKKKRKKVPGVKKKGDKKKKDLFGQG